MTSTVEHSDGQAEPARRYRAPFLPAKRHHGVGGFPRTARRNRLDAAEARRGDSGKADRGKLRRQPDPVREAVLRLADDGLVEVFPQSGTYVSRIPLNRLPEAIVIRKALEEGTVRYAASRASPAEIRALYANLELQGRMRDAGDHEGFHQSDEAFHALLAEISGYPGFWTVIQQVKVQVDRCRRLTLPGPGRISEGDSRTYRRGGGDSRPRPGTGGEKHRRSSGRVANGGRCGERQSPASTL